MLNSGKSQEEREKKKRLLAMIADILLREGLITPGEQAQMLKLVQKG